MEKFKACSSVIDQVYYQENGNLIIKFNSGKFYRYKGVPRKVFEAFAAAESKGIFFNNYIKNLYSCELDLNFQEPQAKVQPEITTFAEILAAAVLAKSEKNGGINANVLNTENIMAAAAKGNVTSNIVKTDSGTTIVIIMIN